MINFYSHCDGLLSGKPTNNGFQLYSTCKEILVSAIPDSLPLVNAAVLPLSISTAASALFLELQAPFPSLNPEATGKKILIWGGSSSVGSATIQLAVAAGLEVLTTASSVNQDFVKSLGASHFFDYKDTDVVDKIASLLKPGDLVVDAISIQDTQAKCAQILAGLGGGKLPLMMPPDVTMPDNVKAVFGKSFISAAHIILAHHVIVNSLSPGLTNIEVGDAVWRKHIPEALSAGKYQAKPDPYVITGGLEKVQDGIDMLRKGVSAKKIVIELSGE